MRTVFSAGHRYIRTFTAFLLPLFFCLTAWAQNAEPSRTQCKQWDDSYLFLLNVFLLAGIFLPPVINLILPPLLGRHFWSLTAPRLRILYLTLFIAVILTTVFVLLPFVTGFGNFIFSGIDQGYFKCETVKFGASGLLFGLLGAGFAAISQWLTVLVLLTISCILGGLIALLVSELLAALIGLKSRVRGGIA